MVVIAELVQATPSRDEESRFLRGVERDPGNLRSSPISRALRVRYLGSDLRHRSKRPLGAGRSLRTFHTRDYLQHCQAPRP